MLFPLHTTKFQTSSTGCYIQSAGECYCTHTFFSSKLRVTLLSAPKPTLTCTVLISTTGPKVPLRWATFSYYYLQPSICWANRNVILLNVCWINAWKIFIWTLTWKIKNSKLSYFSLEIYNILFIPLRTEIFISLVFSQVCNTQMFWIVAESLYCS